MIRGVGTDIVEVARIQAAWGRHGKRFVSRIMTPSEMLRFYARQSDIRLLAKTFALKEAVAKALGTGIAQGVGWHSIETGRDPLGRPVASLQGAAAKRMHDLGAQQVHVSVADEQAYVVAFAVLD